MKFPSEEDVRASWKAAQKDWWAGKISRAEYHRRIHESVVKFHAAENRAVLQWLEGHDAEWDRRFPPPPHVLNARVKLIRRYLKKRNMSAEQFLAHLIAAYQQYTPNTDTEELVQQCIVAKLKSIQKGVTIQ